MTRTNIAAWSLIGLCVSMAAAVGGGFYEHLVVMPLWSGSPPASFSIIQPATGVPLQRFWIPVHAAITLFLLLALVASWRMSDVRRLLLVGLASYIVMRVWSAFYFIPEMLAFQQVPLDAGASPELAERVARWTSRTWWREPLDILSFLCFVLAAMSLKRQPDAARYAGRERRVVPTR
ncbi:MAG TPA: hypothetical protein VK886_04565 [Vicinamibacterales bacterium]|nr:hypothetical protein [Vicinamibacterales bacterium]